MILCRILVNRKSQASEGVQVRPTRSNDDPTQGDAREIVSADVKKTDIGIPNY